MKTYNFQHSFSTQEKTESQRTTKPDPTMISLPWRQNINQNHSNESNQESKR